MKKAGGDNWLISQYFLEQPTVRPYYDVRRVRHEKEGLLNPKPADK